MILHQPARRAYALFMVVIILAILGMLVGSVAVQLTSTRRNLDHRHHRLQATWLARSGVEIAVQKWLADPKGYKGEKIEIIPDSHVTIRVEKQDAEILVTSEARYPTDEPRGVVRVLHRRFRPAGEGEKMRLEGVYSAAADGD